VKISKHVLAGALTVGVLASALCGTAVASSSSDGEPPLPMHDCKNSDWMTQAGGLGVGAAFKTSLRPTSRARVIGSSDNPITHRNNVGYIWRDLKRCVNFPVLSKSQRHSLYLQLACHATYAKLPTVGGPTWDLEAWREDVSPWFAAQVWKHRCNWGPAHPPTNPPPPQPPPPPPPPPSGGDRAKYYFKTWKTAPAFRSPSCSYDDPKCTVGELFAGRNYFFCQSKSSRADAVGPYHNHWWLFTDLDSPRGAKGWVSAAYVTAGGQEQPVPGLPGC
jgi:hypothetical protein